MEEKLDQLEAALLSENAKVNLVSRKDTDALRTHHLLPCLALKEFYSIPDNARVLDLGCGGGLPGLVLAQAFPKAQFTLLDSVGKKIKAVDNIASVLGLINVNTINARAENLNKEYDIVVGRAVTALPAFINWAKPLLAKSSSIKGAGIYYWKGGEIESDTQIYEPELHFLSDLLGDKEYYREKYILHIPTHKLKT